MAERKRKHPGCDRGTLRPDRKDERKAGADARQAARNELTPAQQIARLDRIGWVAKKERARLNKLIGSK